jgi:probable metal-binding protein
MQFVMEERHAHEVMEMMITSGKPYNRETLAAEIRDKFGSGTTFYTCSMKGLSPEELIEFLAQKGKFSGAEDSFIFDPGRMCHGH